MQKQKLLEEIEIKREAERLFSKLKKLGYGLNECMFFAPLTLKINKLKKQKNAVVLAHYYQRPEIQFGIADFRGDSLALAKAAQKTSADIIVFCGVHFMAETAKILNPEKKVLLPSLEAGCSLAESITAKQVKKLRQRFPGAPIVTYINTSAEVKAESDIICTSANAEKIISSLEQDTIIFLPDKLMGKNLAKKTGKNLVLWDGTCVVHESFSVEQIKHYKKQFPGLKIVSHYECSPEIASHSDYMGGTSGMLKYVKNSNASQFMIITECGFSDYLRDTTKNKEFITPCTICPYMKQIHLDKVLQVLEKEENEIIVPKKTALKAKNALQKMLEF